MFKTVFCTLQIIKNELAPDSDPLEILENGSDDVSDATKAFLQNIYQVIQILFIAGVALTLEIALIKVVLSASGTTLEELKKEVGFKIGLVVLFFSFIFIINLVVEAVKAII